MATYSNLSNGSNGEEVRKMQQALIDAGYDLGSSGADGIFGNITEAAVRKYQQDNGLIVDGLAGNQTLGKLYSTSSAGTDTGPTTGENEPIEPPDYSKYAYDPSSNQAYLDALAALQAAKDKVPTYAGTYDEQLEDIYDQIVNRDKFSYNLGDDPLYSQYKDQYINLGQMAMMDTMGQAASLTGGYGSSYGQAVGQQQYDAQLQRLNDVVPELYGIARDQYDSEGEQLYKQYAMMGDLRDDEYGRYQDALDRHFQELGILKGEADDAYSKGYENWYNSYQMGVNADNAAYERQQDNYNKLMTLITSTGYSPTAAELEAAGMSREQANAYAQYYKENKSSGSSGGGSSTYRSASGGGGSSSKSSSSSSSSSSNNNSSTSYTSNYSSFSSSDWKSYFQRIRLNSGKDAAIYELNSLNRQGVIPSGMFNTCYAAATGAGTTPYGQNSEWAQLNKLING